MKISWVSVSQRAADLLGHAWDGKPVIVCVVHYSHSILTFQGMRTAHLGGRFRYQYVQQSQQVLNATLCVTICCSWCACPGLSSALSCCWQICYCMSWRGQIMTFVIIAMCSSPCAAVRALQQLTSRSALQSLSSSQRSFPFDGRFISRHGRVLVLLRRVCWSSWRMSPSITAQCGGAFCMGP